jgi:hypothetical protein
MFQKFRAWRERRQREQQESDEELREEQEAAEERMGIDPGELHTELGQAEEAPWRRGIFARPRAAKEPEAAPPDKEPG